MLSFEILSSTDKATTLKLTIDSISRTVELLNIWLRDNCPCSSCYNPSTYQRLLDLSELSLDVHPSSIGISDEGRLIVTWSDDGHQSEYTKDWLNIHTKPFSQRDPDLIIPERNLWSKSSFVKGYPEVTYSQALSKSPSLYSAVHTYGFCFVTDVPISGTATEQLCNAIGYIRQTHYGGFWQFTTDPSMKDTAYSELEIPSHTDGTYWAETPFLQLFHLLGHDGEGGETTVVDGFQCAQVLKETKPESFEVLKSRKLRFQSLGDVVLSKSKRVIKVDEKGEVEQISFNNSDRSINFTSDEEDLSLEDQFKIYKALKDWYDVLHDAKHILQFQLQPGKVLIFDNWRVLHARVGRTTGKREMCGAYFDRDDFWSNLILSLNPGKEEELFKSL